MNTKLMKQIAIFLVAFVAITVVMLLNNSFGFVLGVLIWCCAYMLFDYWFEEKKK